MSYSRILQSIFPTKSVQTPQTEPMPRQVTNNAGVYYCAMNDWKRLDSFLILETKAGTYYVSPRQLTKENAEVVQRSLVRDGVRVVERIMQISASGPAPKNDTALFAIALAAAPDIETRKVLAALPKVAFTVAHVLMSTDFVNYLLHGWARGLRNGLGRLFLDIPVKKLSLQAVKYSQREGWSLCALLRLAHPKTEDADRLALIDWIVHPVQTHHQHRQRINPNAKLAVLASSANRGSVVSSQNDRLFFGVAGFDPATPNCLQDLSKVGVLAYRSGQRR